jgi:hypothetical protein
MAEDESGEVTPPVATQNIPRAWVRAAKKAEEALARILESAAPTGLAGDRTLSKRGYQSGVNEGEDVPSPKVFREPIVVKHK